MESQPRKREENSRKKKREIARKMFQKVTKILAEEEALGDFSQEGDKNHKSRTR